MANKYDSSLAVAFAAQTDEGVYDTGLDAHYIAGTALDTSDGLILGDPASGLDQSGITFGLGRQFQEMPQVPPSKTRPLSDFQRLVSTGFTVAFPWVGNREQAVGTPPAYPEHDPIPGVNGLLEALGMTSQPFVTLSRYRYQQAEPGVHALLASCLLYANDVAFKLTDCRVSSLAISYPPGATAIATATVTPGAIELKNQVLPTLTYGVQGTVGPPTVELANHVWGSERGWTDGTLTLTSDVQETPDSNAANGIITEAGPNRRTEWVATIFIDSTDAAFDMDQLSVDAVGNLFPASWRIGTPALTTGDTLEAIQINMPEPEAEITETAVAGEKAGSTVTLRASHTAADREIDIIFE